MTGDDADADADAHADADADANAVTQHAANLPSELLSCSEISTCLRLLCFSLKKASREAMQHQQNPMG